MRSSVQFRLKIFALWVLLAWGVLWVVWKGFGCGTGAVVEVVDGDEEAVREEVEDICSKVQTCVVIDTGTVDLADLVRKYPPNGCEASYVKRTIAKKKKGKTKKMQHCEHGTVLKLHLEEKATSLRYLVSDLMPYLLRTCSVKKGGCRITYDGAKVSDYGAVLLHKHFEVVEAEDSCTEPIRHIPSPALEELFTPLNTHHADTQKGFLVLLPRPNPKWTNHLMTNLTQLGFEPTLVGPPSTPEEFSELVAGVERSKGLVVLYSSEFVPVLRYLPRGGIVVCISPRGMGYSDGPDWVQELATRSHVTVMNTRNYEDSVQKTSVRGYSPLEPIVFAKDEVKKMGVELRVLVDSGGKAEEEGVREKAGKNEYTRLSWYLPRTRYDPDHFMLGPVSITKGVLKMYNKTKLAVEHHQAKGFLTQPHDKELLKNADFKFGYYKENDKHYYPAVNVTHSAEALNWEACDDVVDGTVYIHYPWVRDNIYHSHNDNFWPLFLSMATYPQEAAHMYLLPTKRSNKPVSAYPTILSALFKSWSWYPPSTQTTTTCIPRIVWGRPRRLFSTKHADVAPYTAYRVLPKWRGFIYTWAGINAKPDPARFPLRVTWLDRRPPGKRVLTNADSLLKELSRLRLNSTHMGTLTLETRKCCEGLSFAEQASLMAATDILIGTHGAGLLHIVFLRPGSVAVHLMPPRMNYHEQLIIERIAHASNVLYMNTHLNTPPDRRGEWNIDAYAIPPKDYPLLVRNAALLFASKNMI